MKKYKLLTSEGYRDIFGNEAIIRKDVENTILNLFSAFGYNLVKTPTLEYIDVFSVDGMQKPDLYNLINRSGEVLSLSNDITSSIARFVASNHYEIPLKYCYSSEVFRYPKEYQGKSHQFLQAGIEIIGREDKLSDLECIYLAYKALRACNIDDFTVHIGSLKFLNDLFNDLKIDLLAKKEIFSCIENKDFVSMKNVLYSQLEKSQADLVIDLMMRGGKIKFLESLKENLAGYSCVKEIDYLIELYQVLKSLQISNIIFDFSIYSYAKYYTGIVFQIYLDKVSKAIVEGGRCDNIFKYFELDYKNIGFGLDIDAITSYKLSTYKCSQKIIKILAISDNESILFAFENNNELRKKGYIVDQQSFKDLNSTLKFAQKNNYDYIIYYKNNEAIKMEVESC